MPIGAHKLLGFLAEPLKQLSEHQDNFEAFNVSDNLREFQDWVCLILAYLVTFSNLLLCYFQLDIYTSHINIYCH